jgi:hypothetical protein
MDIWLLFFYEDIFLEYRQWLSKSYITSCLTNWKLQE